MGVFGGFFFGIICFSSLSWGTQLNSSVLIVNDWDIPTCKPKIDQTLKFGNKRILVLTTAHFRVQGRAPKMIGYCYEDGISCKDYTDDHLLWERDKLAECFKYAVQSGLDLTIMPHIDDQARPGYWRNELKFDPLAKYQNYTYEEVLLNPIIGALQQIDDLSHTSIDFYLEGEMGATLFFAPRSHLQILKNLKSKIPKARIGIALNFNKVNGGTKNKNKKLVQELFDKVDFIGVSAYHGVQEDVQPSDFLGNVNDAKSDLQELGVIIKDDKEFQFAEIGLGGAWDESQGKSPAPSVASAALNPWCGILTPYSVPTDPWKNLNLREFRLKFYGALLNFLSHDGVKVAFQWNMGSWDPEGLTEPRYADNDIIQMIIDHNRQN